MARKKTHEEYVEELSIKNPIIDVIDIYIDSKTPISHKCKKHNILWNAIPSNILHGHGCPMCGGNAKKTNEQYIDEVKNINKFIDVIGIYVNAKTKIAHRCKIDGHIWYALPYVILRGDGCPKCAGNAKKTTEDYIKELKIANPNIEVVEEYTGANYRILHRCKIDGHEWLATPANILFGCGCPECRNRMLSDIFVKSHNTYVEQLSFVNPDLEVIGEYVNAKTPILHRCKVDGYVWKITPSNVLSGQGCPQCQESIGERKIRQWLESNNITYIYQKSFEGCNDKKTLPFDFYIPDYNLCIEFDGRQHFEPVDFSGKGEDYALEQFLLTQYHDSIKTKYCEGNNIKLLRIPYFKNIEEELNNFIHLI